MTATLVVIGLLITHSLSSLTRSELGVSRWFVDHRTPWGNDWTGWASRIADTVGIVAVLVVAVVVLVALGRRWSAVLLAVALALEVLTFITVNAIVGRPRPPVVRLGSLPSTSSFPSGHTAAMMAIYGALAITIGGRSRARTVACWIVTALATIAVGYARVYRGMHHVSDVTAGALMGLAALAVASAAVRAGKQTSARTQTRPTNDHLEVTS
jgi:undecaprenyl-diphosphatase